MRNIKKITTLLLSAALTLSLVACGSSSGDYASKSMTDSFETNKYAPSVMTNMEMNEGWSDESPSEIQPSEDSKSNGSQQVETSSEIESTNKKLITTYSITLETKKYDETITNIENSLKNVNGYIESERTSKYNEYGSTSLTIRIPSDKAEEWVNATELYGVVTENEKTTEDVTLQYIDVESRLKSYKTEQTTLMNLLENASTIEEIITIQDRLRDINYNIENYESTIRSLSNQVDYSTIHIYIDEVSVEIPTVLSFGDRILMTFQSSLNSVGSFFQNLIIFVVGCSPLIVLWALITVFIIKIIKKIKLKHQLKKKTIATEKPKEIQNNKEL